MTAKGWRRVAVGSWAAGAVLLMAGSSDDVVRARLVEAKMVRIVDDEGTQVAGMDTFEGMPRLFMRDGPDRPNRLTIGLMRSGAATVSLFNRRGEGSLSLSAGYDTPDGRDEISSVTIYDKDGRTRFTLEVSNRDNPSMRLIDARGGVLARLPR